MEFMELTASEYDAFVLTHPYGNFLNASAAFEMKRENGFAIAYVGVKEKNKVIAASGISFIPWKRFFTYAYCQRGFLLDYDNTLLLTFFHENLVAYCKRHHAAYISCDPYVVYRERDRNGDLVEGGYDHEAMIAVMKQLGYLHQGFTTGFDPNQQVRWAFVLDLRGHDEQSLLKNMDTLRRRCIKKAIRQGILVKEAGLQDLSAFMKIMDYAADTRGFHKLSKSYYEQRLRYLKDDAKMMIAYLDVNDYRKRMELRLMDIKEALHKLAVSQTNRNLDKYQKKQNEMQNKLQMTIKHIEDVWLLQQKYGDMIALAGAFYIRHGNTLTYLSAGAYDEFKSYHGADAIHWHMMRYALQEGITRYDFYGISGDFSEQAVDHGVFECKKGFGGVVEEYVGVFDYPIHKNLYRLLK